MNARQQRGKEIANLFRIIERNGRWCVPSTSDNGKYYIEYSETKSSCSCKDFAKQGEKCKHIYAVEFVIKGDLEPEPEPEPDPISIRKRTTAERKTYKQVWPAYNAAQTNEK